MVVVKPFNLIYFIDASGAVALKGLLVTKSCCPHIARLHSGVEYVMFTSTIEGNSDKRFIHVYRLECLQDLVQCQVFGNIVTMDVVHTRHNPWVPLPNETRKKVRRRKKKLVTSLSHIMLDYVMLNKKHLCSRCCVRGAYHHPMLWRQMVMNGKLGLNTSGIKLDNVPYDEEHVFNNDLVDEVCKELRL
jgi:hypothetical protein